MKKNDSLNCFRLLKLKILKNQKRLLIGKCYRHCIKAPIYFLTSVWKRKLCNFPNIRFLSSCCKKKSFCQRTWSIVTIATRLFCEVLIISVFFRKSCSNNSVESFCHKLLIVFTDIGHVTATGMYSELYIIFNFFFEIFLLFLRSYSECMAFYYCV